MITRHYTLEQKRKRFVEEYLAQQGKPRLTDEEKMEAFLKMLEKENELRPTPIGLEKYDGGYYEDYPCTCTESCAEYDCNGECGCGACSAAYADNRDFNEQYAGEEND